MNKTKLKYNIDLHSERRGHSDLSDRTKFTPANSADNELSPVSTLEKVAIVDLDEFHRGKINHQDEQNFFSGDLDKIINSAIQIAKDGIRHLLIISGEKLAVNTDVVSFLIYSIKRHTDVEISLCFGKRNFPDFKNWQIAGANNYIFLIDEEIDSTECRNQIECIRKSGLHLHLGFYIEDVFRKTNGFSSIIRIIRTELPDAVVPVLPGGLNSPMNFTEANFVSRLKYFILMLRTYFKDLEIYYCNYHDSDGTLKESELQLLGATKVITRHR